MKPLAGKRATVIAFVQKVALLSNTRFVSERQELKDLVTAIIRDIQKFQQDLSALRPIPDLVTLQCPRDIITRIDEACAIIDRQPPPDFKTLLAALPITDTELTNIIDAIVDSKRPIHELHNNFMSALGRHRDILFQRGKDAAVRLEEAFLVSEFSSASSHFIREMGAERTPTPDPAPPPQVQDPEVARYLERLEDAMKGLEYAKERFLDDSNEHLSQLDGESERAKRLIQDIEQFDSATKVRLEKLRTKEKKPRPRAKKVLAIPIIESGPDKERFDRIREFDRQIRDLRVVDKLQSQLQAIESDIAALSWTREVIKDIEEVGKAIPDADDDINAMKAIANNIERLLRDM